MPTDDSHEQDADAKQAADGQWQRSADVSGNTSNHSTAPYSASTFRKTTSRTSESGHGTAPSEASSDPTVIDDFVILAKLGVGGSGTVYLAESLSIGKQVAIKLSHGRCRDRNDPFREGKILAQLDRHPHILPVYHAAVWHDRPYLVCKYVDGSTLADLMRSRTLDPYRSVEIVVTVAEALQFAHQRGLCHRDIKPSNVLIENDGTVYLTDFDVAVPRGTGSETERFVGTLRYMSPEQAAGRAHQLDGRSDIFSLGIVLFELLTGNHPFGYSSAATYVETLQTSRLVPTAEEADKIPAELRSLCLKALQRSRSNRFQIAAELAESLRQWLSSQHYDSDAESEAARTPILPKGLLAFGPDDADFYMNLLPGPKDAHGVPQSILNWRSHLEESDAPTFPIGLIHGPSGAGKTSWIRAGLLPRLGKHVRCCYVTASAKSTEASVREQLNALRSSLSDTDTKRENETDGTTVEPPLHELLQEVAERLPARHKLLIVIDQFEQWLSNHAYETLATEELVNLTKRCDSRRVQLLLSVRSEFWLGISRFLAAARCSTSEGHNSSLIDLFDEQHAQHVLTQFGIAYGKLPADAAEMTDSQRRFIQKAIEELAENHQVVSVRLALFADMMKGRTWNTASLVALGGAEGVGVRFLDERLGAVTLFPKYRYHADAARAILRAFVSSAPTLIRGAPLTRESLLIASGYADRPHDFAAVMEILCRDLRLLAPTDADKTPAHAMEAATTANESFQLTHDYLVTVLAKWFAPDHSTAEGRAEACLAERTKAFQQTGDKRSLPTWIEYVRIVSLTRWRRWGSAERSMLSRMTRMLLTRVALILVPLLLLTSAWHSWHEESRRLVDDLARRGGVNSEATIRKLQRYGATVEVPLVELLSRPIPNPRQDKPSEQRRASHLAASRSRADAAIVLAQVGSNAALLKAFPMERDPEIATQFVERASVLGLPTLLDLLEGANNRRTAQDVTQPQRWERFVFTLLLALGDFDQDELPAATQQRLLNQLRHWYVHDRSSAIHGASGWLLRRWQPDVADQADRETALSSLPSADYDKEWFTLFVLPDVPMTFIVFDRGEYDVGASQLDGSGLIDEPVRRLSCDHKFAVLDREITRREVEAFGMFPDEDHRKDAEMQAREPTSAKGYINWYESVAFCRWLTQQLGLDESQQAYLDPHVALASGIPDDSALAEATGQRLPRDWPMTLEARGFRLPTELEWEVSCRGSTPSIYSFGSDAKLLPRYGWCLRKPLEGGSEVRLFRPNRRGLFDQHGNVHEWCHDWGGNGREGVRETFSNAMPEFGEQPPYRTHRGGAWMAKPELCRAADRSGGVPHRRFANVGFRPALTLPE